jgi:RNA-directed DNA polymerase
VTRNLYVVMLPGLTETTIEHFFDAQTLGIVINGRTFSLDLNAPNSGAHYPKSMFADQVVKQRTTIDFSGFMPILDRIVQVQAHHATIVIFETANPS